MRALLLLTTLATLSTPLLARDTWDVPVKPFDSIELDTAIEAEIVCADEAKVVVETTRKTFDDLDIRVHGGELSIDRDMHFSNWFGSDQDSVFVTIYTTGPLHQLDAHTAAEIQLPECAVAQDSLKVRVSTGASVKVAGETQQLDLKASTGASFNSGRYRNELKVGSARVKLSTGATAGLCGASVVEGKLSTGADAFVSNEAEVDVKLSSGGDITYSRCR